MPISSSTLMCSSSFILWKYQCRCWFTQWNHQFVFEEKGEGLSKFWYFCCPQCVPNWFPTCSQCVPQHASTSTHLDSMVCCANHGVFVFQFCQVGGQFCQVGGRATIHKRKEGRRQESRSVFKIPLCTDDVHDCNFWQVFLNMASFAKNKTPK